MGLALETCSGVVGMIRCEAFASSSKLIYIAALQLGSREASAMGQGYEKAAQPPRDDQGRRQRQSGLLQTQEGTIMSWYLV